ncbi:MAG TPA: AAC(3) family N-acetyltransferase [Epulopiscium sp.]|nr:AAC(3) family N-acetyltransferase [Candidatus Epulonipiscium sp.]
MSINGIIRKIVPNSLRSRLKKAVRKASTFNKEKISLKELKDILTHEMDIRKGDTIIVHSSFGRLNVNATPEEVVELLKNIITSNGTIMMPYYPGKGQDWLESDSVFNVKTTKSVMGILTNVFASSEDVLISHHPIKAVAIWGKDKELFCSSHSDSITPYDKKSPYYLGLKHGRYIGLGLGIIKNTFVHSCQDVLESFDNNLIYNKTIYSGKLLTQDGELINVKTLCHDIGLSSSKKYKTSILEKTNCPTFKKSKNKNTLVFAVDNHVVYEHLDTYYKKIYSDT